MVILAGFSAGGMMLFFISIVYGVDPITAVNLFREDVVRCALIAPWILLTGECTRWLSSMTRRLHAAAYSLPAPPSSDTSFKDVVVAGAIAAMCVYGIRFIEDLM